VAFMVGIVVKTLLKISMAVPPKTKNRTATWSYPITPDCIWWGRSQHAEEIPVSW
jgi:hypothetical protein